jgi:hypothetical protein
MGPYTLPNAVPQSQGALIQGIAWFPDLGGPALAFMDKQVGPNTYLWRSQDDSTQLSGPCQLVPGDVTEPGQASVIVTPYGFTSGYGAAAYVANISIAEVTVANPGISGFLAGQTYAVNGGTQDGAEGIVEVTRFTGTNFNVSGGSSFIIGSTIGGTIGNSITYAGFEIHVTNVDISGAVTGFNVITTGSSGGTASTSGATFDGNTGTGAVITFDTVLDTVYTQYGSPLTVINSGAYSDIPSWGTDIYYLGSGGAGATINISAWFSNSIVVTDSGESYSSTTPPTVLVYDPFQNGTQTAVATVVDGHITNIALTGTRRTFPQSQQGAIDGGRMFPAVSINPLALPTATLTFGPYNYYSEAADIVNGGSLYTAGDTVTLVGGTYTGDPATAYINSVDGSGAVTYWSWNYSAAKYSAFPTNPVTFTDGTGSGLQVNITYKNLAPYNVTVTDPGGYPGYNAWGPFGPPVFVTPSGPASGPEGAIFYPVGNQDIGITGVGAYGPEGNFGQYYLDADVQIGFAPLEAPTSNLPQAQKIMDNSVLTWGDQIYKWYLDTAGNILPDATWAFLGTGYQTIVQSGPMQLWYQDRGLFALNGGGGSEGAASGYGWDSSGIWFNGNAGSSGTPAYPIFTSFAIPDTTAATVRFTFTYGPDYTCDDISVAVYQDGVIPRWAWSTNNTRIAASFNCRNPWIYGLQDSVEGSEGALTLGHTYNCTFVYDPTLGVSTLRTVDAAGGLDDLITLTGQALPAGNYRVGFAADQDANQPDSASYINSITISYAGASYQLNTTGTPPVIEPYAFTFDPHYTSPAILLSDPQPTSGGNITVTAASAISEPEGAIMYTAITPGQRVMFSMTLDQSAGASGNDNIGLASRAFNPLAYLGLNSYSIAYWNSGNWTGADSGSGLYSYTTGDDIDVAVDFDGGAIWWAVNGNPWNSNLGADPAAGTGGISLGTLTTDYLALYPGVSCYNGGTGTQWTVRNSGVRAVPTGFTFLSNP